MSLHGTRGLFFHPSVFGKFSLRGRDPYPEPRHPSLAYLIPLYPTSILLHGGGPENFNVCCRKTSGKDAGWWFGGFCRWVWKNLRLYQLYQNSLLDAGIIGAKNPLLQTNLYWSWPKHSLHRGPRINGWEGVVMETVLKRAVQSLCLLNLGLSEREINQETEV